MPACVIVNQQAVKFQQLQLVFSSLPEKWGGDMEATLNALGVMGHYVQVSGGKRAVNKYDVYVSAYANAEMINEFISTKGLYRSSPAIWIDGTITEDETVTVDDRIPDQYV